MITIPDTTDSSNVTTVPVAPPQKRVFSITFTPSVTDKVNVLQQQWPFSGVGDFFKWHGHLEGEKEVAARSLDTTKLCAYGFYRLRSGGKNIDDDVESLSAVVLDFDNKNPSTHETLPLGEQVTVDDIATLLPCRALIHTSYSHSAARSCFRVIVPLSRDISPTEFPGAWKYLVELTGGVADPTCKNPSRIYFMPRRPVGTPAGTHIITVVDGALFDVDALPATTACIVVPHGDPSAHRTKPKPGLHIAEPDMLELTRKLELFREEPIVACMLAGEVELPRDPWRFIGDAIAAVCEPFGAAGLEEGRKLFHEASSTDDRPHHGYDQKGCDSQWNDSARRAKAAIGNPDEQSKLFVTYSKLAELGAPAILCTTGDTFARAPAAWVERKYNQQTGYGVAEQSLLEAFSLALGKDAKVAVDAAMLDDDLLLAIGSQQSKNVLLHERLVQAIKQVGVTTTAITSLVRMAKAKWHDHRVLVQVAKAAPAIAAAANTALPMIEVKDRQLNTMRDDTERALVAANTPPTMFTRGKTIVRLEGTSGATKIADHTAHSLRHYVSRIAKFVEFKASEGVEVPVNVVVPYEIIEDLIAVPPAALPRLQRVVATPVFSKAGVLLETQGYYAADELFLALPAGFTVPPVSPIPTAAEVEKAKALLFDDLWVDFPLMANADKAHVLACALLPFAREMIDGPTPLHVFEATKSGTGKSKLGNTIALIGQGAPIAWRPLPTKEEEREKTVFTALRSGGIYFGLDNTRGKVDSPSIESALTSTSCSARIFNTQTEQDAPNKAVWLLTANNAELSADLARRSIRIRQDAGMEKPALRTNFKHKPLEPWALANRNKLVHGVLTIIQNWIALGKPAFKGNALGSFESWSTVMGGILEAAGVAGFLDVGASMAVDDEDSVEGRAFVEAWHATRGTKPVTAKQLYEDICIELVDTNKGGTPAIYKTSVRHLGSKLTGPEGGHVMKVGRWIKDNKDGAFGNVVVRIVGPDSHDKMMRYQLEDKSPVAAIPAEALTVSQPTAVVKPQPASTSWLPTSEPAPGMPDFSAGL